MKLKLEDLKIQSFITNVTASKGIKGGARTVDENTEIPCSAIDACPTTGGDVDSCPYEIN